MNLYRSVILNRVPSRSGFTIVELLIVIVIIAILATLVIVTFNTVQSRARNSQTTHAVETFKKAFIAYATEHNGTYPNVSGVTCIGEGYPDLGEDPGPDCQGGMYVYPVESEPNNTLKQYLGGKIPSPSMSQIRDGNQVVKIGIQYLNQSVYKLNHQQHPWWLSYVLEGTDTKCPVGPVYAASDDWTDLDLLVDRSETYDNGVVCMMPLPDPSTL